MEKIEFVHKPVLYDEVIESLEIKPDGIYVDGTAGGAGHSSGIASRLTTGKLIAFDRDEEAVKVASERLARFGERATVVHSNFSEIKKVLAEMGIEHIDGFLIDLGLSSFQIDEPSRGFSFSHDAKLDMRMNVRDSLSAYDVVNGYSADELKRIFFEYGEERFAPSIARAIVREREIKPIETTFELVDIIRGAMPGFSRNGTKHPEKRVFQAIRIEVNNELGVIEQTIRDAVSIMNEGAVISVITFHSLEDRIVKALFKEMCSDCVCDPKLPQCICNHVASLELKNRKPIVASEEELKENSRSHSAKLRVARRINTDKV